MHNTRTLKVKQLKRSHPWLILLFTPVLFLLCGVKISAVKRANRVLRDVIHTQQMFKSPHVDVEQQGDT